MAQNLLKIMVVEFILISREGDATGPFDLALRGGD